MRQSSEKKWFIAKIKPNSYTTAIQNLTRQGFETFLPQMKVTQRQQNKFVIKNVHVFPGYIFVCFDPRVNAWNKVNSTYGVSKILGFNDKPSEISSDLILELKTRYAIKINTTQSKTLQKGDSIKFCTGPFTDLIAKVESVDENKRIWVLLEAMGGYQRLKLQNSQKISLINFKD